MDFNKHTFKFNRESFTYHLNEDWKEEYGGCLKLQNKKTSTSTKNIPLFNTAVVFSTTSFSYHGNPDTINIL